MRNTEGDASPGTFIRNRSRQRTCFILHDRDYRGDFHYFLVHIIICIPFSYHIHHPMNNFIVHSARVSDNIIHCNNMCCSSASYALQKASGSRRKKFLAGGVTSLVAGSTIKPSLFSSTTTSLAAAKNNNVYCHKRGQDHAIIYKSLYKKKLHPIQETIVPRANRPSMTNPQPTTFTWSDLYNEADNIMSSNGDGIESLSSFPKIEWSFDDSDTVVPTTAYSSSTPPNLEPCTKTSSSPVSHEDMIKNILSMHDSCHHPDRHHHHHHRGLVRCRNFSSKLDSLANATTTRVTVP